MSLSLPIDRNGRPSPIADDAASRPRRNQAIADRLTPAVLSEAFEERSADADRGIRLGRGKYWVRRSKRPRHRD